MYIREIRNPLYFQELCQALLTAEYEDFETVRDYNGDKGNDGYLPSRRRLYAIHCPVKSDKTPAKFREKINGDLRKAVALRDKHGYDIKEWVFVTPEPLSLELRSHVSAQATAAGFESGVNLSDKRLQDLFYKHAHLHPIFPDLAAVNLREDIHRAAESVVSNLGPVTIEYKARDKGWRSLMTAGDLKTYGRGTMFLGFALSLLVLVIFVFLLPETRLFPPLMILVVFVLGTGAILNLIGSDLTTKGYGRFAINVAWLRWQVLALEFARGDGGAVKAVSVVAACPICRSEVRLEDLPKGSDHRLMGFCQNNPQMHTFTFDPTTFTGFHYPMVWREVNADKRR